MRSLLSLLFFLAFATPALASDGVLEINQACATSADGCFPGDAGGWPVTIASRGSYRLTGNLSVPTNTKAVQIDSNLVTLDLGGFSVDGTNTCSGYPVLGCTLVQGVPGIQSSQYLVTVRNGSVTGMGGGCIYLTGPSSEVDNVRVLFCGWHGIEMGPLGRVSRSASVANMLYGISMNDGGWLVDSETRGNRGQGVYMGGTSHGGSLIQNLSTDNGGTGLQAGSSLILVTKNVATGNAVVPQISGGTSLGDNMCVATRC
jgi:hypothetical protein